MKIKICDTKMRFTSMAEARYAADSYMARVALTFDPMVPYRCMEHSCWHIGHDTHFFKWHRERYALECVYRYRRIEKTKYEKPEESFAI